MSSPKAGSLLLPRNRDDSIFIIVEESAAEPYGRWFKVWDVQTGAERAYPEAGLLASFEVDDG